MSGSCHLHRASNVKLVLNVKYLLLLPFLTEAEFYNFGHIQGVYYKGALSQKRPFLVICTTFRSAFHVSWKNQNKHSTLNSSFNTVQMTWTRHKTKYCNFDEWKFVCLWKCKFSSATLFLKGSQLNFSSPKKIVKWMQVSIRSPQPIQLRCYNPLP